MTLLLGRGDALDNNELEERRLERSLHVDEEIVGIAEKYVTVTELLGRKEEGEEEGEEGRAATPTCCLQMRHRRRDRGAVEEDPTSRRGFKLRSSTLPLASTASLKHPLHSGSGRMKIVAPTSIRSICYICYHLILIMLITGSVLWGNT